MRRVTKKIVIGSIAFALFGLLLLSYSYFVEPARLVINRQKIPIAGWNTAFNGLRIAVIGDIHGGSNGADAEEIRRMVSETNKLNPDLIVLLGDYVSQAGSTRRSDELKMPMHDVAE